VSVCSCSKPLYSIICVCVFVCVCMCVCVCVCGAINGRQFSVLSYVIYRLMQMFKKYLADMEGKDAGNLLNLCLDIEAYYTMMDNKTTKHKKDMQANHIYKSVHSHKCITFPLI